MDGRVYKILCWFVILFADFLGGNMFAFADNLNVVHLGSFSKAVDYAPYFIAKRKHWFEEGLKPWHAIVTYDVFQTLPSINESFASKKIDAVFEGEIPAIVGRAAGIDIEIKGLSAIVAQQILVRKNSDIKTIADLKGKSIAALAGSSAHYGLLKNLERAGLSKKDVSIVDMTPPDARSAFESSKVDAWAVWPPFIQQVIISGTGFTIPGSDYKVNIVMTMRRGFTIDHKDWAAALLQTLNRSKAWILKNPVEAQKIMSEELNVPLNVVQLAWPINQFNAELNPSVITDIQNKADFLKSAGFVRQSINVQDSLVSSPPRSALQ